MSEVTCNSVCRYVICSVRKLILLFLPSMHTLPMHWNSHWFKKKIRTAALYMVIKKFLLKVLRRIFTKTFHSIILPKTVFIKHDLVKSCTVLGILFVFNPTTQLLKHFLISQRVGKHVCQIISIYLFHQHEVPRVSISFFHQHRCACCFYLCSPPS